MSKTIDVGIATAYGAAVRGGYEGTYEQFCEDLARLADVLSEFLGFSVTVETLAAGTPATGDYEAGVLSLGIPRGETGNGIQSIVLNADYTLTVTYTNGQTWTSGPIRGETGATPDLQIGTVATLSPGSPATAGISGTPEEPRLNLGIPQGAPGEVPAASFAPEYDASSTYAVGEYVMHNNALYRCTTAITTAEAWTAAHWTAAKLAEDLTDCSRQLSDLDDDVTGKADKTTYQTVTGTTLTLAPAVDNTIYLCGELTELTITPPTSGIFAVRFTSGTTPTVVTLNNITMPDDWPTTLDASTTYEINVLNGLGVWQAWI